MKTSFAAAVALLCTVSFGAVVDHRSTVKSLLTEKLAAITETQTSRLNELKMMSDQKLSGKKACWQRSLEDELAALKLDAKWQNLRTSLNDIKTAISAGTVAPEKYNEYMQTILGGANPMLTQILSQSDNQITNLMTQITTFDLNANCP